jgi:hypothetical protein
VAGWLVLACVSGAQAPKAGHEAAKAGGGEEIAFPPTGPIELHPAAGPDDGTFYQLLMSYEGRTELSDDRPGRSADQAQTVDEKTSLEVDYRSMPVATPSASEHAWSLVLEAAKRRTRLLPPGDEHTIEVGDDRLRVMTNDKVGADLRGAQPKKDLTPRSLLGKPFALVITDGNGNPKGINVRGLPPAKKMLSSLPLRESLGYVQIAYPDRPVSPGDTWHAKRFLPNPIGKLGLAVDVELRFVGFERIGSAPCAHVSLRSKVDDKNVASESGFTFEEVRLQLAGDAWLDLSTGQVAAVRIEDVTAISYRTTSAANPMRARMRYEGRSALQRLDALPESTHWADGSKRFSAVK